MNNRNHRAMDLSEDVEDHSRDSCQDQTHRKLKNRHIQLIGIGGTIGTLLFVQIGSALTKGGPASLFLAFAVWCTFILAMNNCLAEMVTWMPISSPFARYADRFVDPALGFASGVNYFIYEASLVPFEMVAFNLVIHYWTDKIPLAACIVFILVCYALFNLFAVRFYGEIEFWLGSGKIILAIGLVIFTFITMLGGNPLHDRYGFRNWDSSKVLGAPFAEYTETGNLGRFLGFLTCLILAAITVTGPEYVSMTAGEAEHPRRNMPKAFSSVFFRLTTFFLLGTLCVGTIVPYSDPDLRKALSDARPGAGSSPYVIAMQHLNIKVLPEKTPSSYIRFYAALKAQGISRDILPYKSPWQPFCAYYALTGTFIMAFVAGYIVFLPGQWKTTTFLFSYAMIGVCPALYLFWKIFKKTKWRNLEEIDFFSKERAEIDAYERRVEVKSNAHI